MTKEEAYDSARREFYTLRQQEEIERRIAQEEAKMVGGYFGMSQLRVGMKIEDKQYEHWKAWATKQIALVNAERQAAYTSFGDEDKTIDQLEEEEQLVQ
jgi:small subunit ribosomal protein S23